MPRSRSRSRSRGRAPRAAGGHVSSAASAHSRADRDNGARAAAAAGSTRSRSASRAARSSGKRRRDGHSRSRSRSRSRRRSRSHGRKARRRDRSRSRSRSKSRSRAPDVSKDRRKRRKKLAKADRRRRDRKHRKRRRGRSPSSAGSSSSRSSSASSSASSAASGRSRSSSPPRSPSAAEARLQRKLEKQQLKEDLRRQKEALLTAQLTAQLGYTDADNPFNDQNLTSKFVWAKKRAIEARSGVPLDERKRLEEMRHAQVSEELARLRARRSQREEDQRLREEEEARMRRERDAALLGDWEKRENDFVLGQMRRRALIRVREGRARPVDVLAINIALYVSATSDKDDDRDLAKEFDKYGIEMEAEEPYLIFNDLELDEVDDLYRDIQQYMRLEETEIAQDYWNALLTICEAELARLREKAGLPSLQHLHSTKASRAPTARLGVTREVQRKIDQLLGSKTSAQLDMLEKQVRDKLESGGPIDVEYWEALLKSLHVWKARAHIGDLHREMLRVRLERLRELRRQEQQRGEGGVEVQDRIKVSARDMLQKTRAAAAAAAAAAASAAASANANNEDSTGYYQDEDAIRRFRDMERDLATVRDEMLLGDDEKTFDEGVANQSVSLQFLNANGALSPPHFSQLDRDDRLLRIVDEDTDYTELLDARRHLLREDKVKIIRPKVQPANASASNVKEGGPINLGMEVPSQDVNDEFGATEAAFGDEVGLLSSSYGWSDKYRPRKPRYVNRVNTGYEWNKYNRTHYDTDNPPPKVVQGYKFNVFYPDLIDKTKAPTYRIERDEGYPDTVILRFIAGPPYEDVAFRIVNKEWEYSHRHGFRCSFDRGVLQLHFRFKRHFYRR